MRLIFCVLVAVVSSVVCISPAFAQFPSARDPAEWYYCYTSRTNSSISPPSNGWQPMTCEHLLWQEAVGGGGYHSLVMEGGATTFDGVGYAEMWAVVVPPRGIRWYESSCQASALALRVEGAGSVAVTVRTSRNAIKYGYGATSQWLVNSTASTGTPEGEPVVNVINVVNEHWSNHYDNFWTDDMATWGVDGAEGVDTIGWSVVANGGNENRTAEGVFNCHIVDWGSWEDWLEVPGNDEWLPGPIDFPPVLDVFPSVPITWVDWGPVETTVTFGISDAVLIDCYTIIPTISQSVEFWLGNYSIGYEGVEMCVSERALDMTIDQFDLGAWARNIMILMGVGALWFMIVSR